MTLIVENGTNVPNANSYADLTYIRAYALNRGVTLSVVDADVEAMVFKSMDYIESVASNYQGTKTYTAPTYTPQSLQFPRSAILYQSIYPRTANYLFNPYLNPNYDPDFYPYVNYDGIKPSPIRGIMIDCVRIANNIIPQTLKDLLCQCVLATNIGIDFANYGQEQKFAIMEKVGPLEAQYSDKFGKTGEILISSINKYFRTLTCGCGSHPRFTPDIVTE